MRLSRTRPVLLALLLVPAAAVFGFIGYASVPGSNPTLTDTLFRTLQLFALEGGLPAQGTPWQLDVARFLAPLSLLYAAVVAVIALLRDQVQALLSAFARGHVLVVGLGHTGTRVAKGLREGGWPVVVLESDRHSAEIGAARAAGVRVIVGGSSSTFLARAQVARARHVVVLTGADSRNLEVAAVVRHTIMEKGSRPATIHVEISNVGLWKELSRLQLSVATAPTTTEYFNLTDRTAQRLLGELERLPTAGALDQVLVEGVTPLATRVVSHLVHRAMSAGIRPRIDLSSAADGEPLARLRREEPWCFEHADIRAVQIDGPYARNAVPVALACLVEDDAAAITRGLVLARQLPGTDVLVTVFRDGSETTLEAAGVTVPRLHLVSVRMDALGRELLEHSGVELMAKVRHEDYVRRERAGGSTQQDNPSLVEWERLPDSLKESNRRFAECVAAVMTELGGAVVPLTGPASDDGLGVDAATLDRLARAEHERWMEALGRDGWRPTTGSKDAQRKVHPLLVPWDELGEEEREKDRDAFRALPHMLARVGCAIVMPKDAG